MRRKTVQMRWVPFARGGRGAWGWVWNDGTHHRIGELDWDDSPIESATDANVREAMVEQAKFLGLPIRASWVQVHR